MIRHTPTNAPSATEFLMVLKQEVSTPPPADFVAALADVLARITKEKAA